MTTIIRVSKLGKQYDLHQQRPQKTTLREAVERTLKRRWTTLRNGDRAHEPANETIWALKDVSFEIEQGETVGFIGHNGAGKSTLLKILAHITEPTEGWAWVDGRVGALFGVGTGFHKDLTGRENVYLNGVVLGMKPGEIDRKFDEIVSFAELERFIDSPVKHYSSGMYTRLGFAIFAHFEPEILLVDEVLSAGDVRFREKAANKISEISQSGITTIFVSHNTATLRKLCDRALLLEQGQVVGYGSAETVIDQYTESAAALAQPVQPQPQACSETGLLYEAPETTAPGGVVTLIKLEMLSKHGRPKPKLRTWDLVIFRLHYWARETVAKAAVSLNLFTPQMTPVLQLQSAPLMETYLDLQPGHHYVDCVVPRFPLTAGKYVVGATMNLSEQCLFNDQALATITVKGRDIYRSGVVPRAGNGLVATKYHWEPPELE